MLHIHNHISNELKICQDTGSEKWYKGYMAIIKYRHIQPDTADQETPILGALVILSANYLQEIMLNHPPFSMHISTYQSCRLNCYYVISENLGVYLLTKF